MVSITVRQSHAVLRCILLAQTLIAFGTACAQDPAPRLALPLDPIESVTTAFDTYDLVALSAPGYEEGGAFWLALLRSPRFQTVVDDIVVEFGASRYQDVMDRFTSGEPVAYDELEKAWQQTTQPHHVADPPMYERFFRAVRDINASLPPEHRLRVVLAEPPIDWSVIEDFEDLLPWLQRRLTYEAEVVEREILAKNRRALLLSGASHYLNETPLLNAINAHGKRVLRIWATNEEDLADLQPNVRSWPRPSFALIGGTVLGAADIAGFYKAAPAPPGPLEKHYDAVLYFGAPSELTPAQIAPELCRDRDYLDMRLPRLRMAAANGGAGWLEEFTAYCAGVTGR
jgi:hypothetical protein